MGGCWELGRKRGKFLPLRSLTALEILDLSSLNLECLPAHLTALRQLAALALADNVRLGLAGRQAWQPLAALAGSLTALDLSQCNLPGPPALLSAFGGLKELSLANSPLLGPADWEDPEGARWRPLAALTSLTRLSLSCCDLKALPR